jgi:hypothetical protein
MVGFGRTGPVDVLQLVLEPTLPLQTGDEEQGSREVGQGLEGEGRQGPQQAQEVSQRFLRVHVRHQFYFYLASSFLDISRTVVRFVCFYLYIGTSSERVQ